MISTNKYYRIKDIKVNIFGTQPEDIDNAEDRYKFSRLLDGLQVLQPQWKTTEEIEVGAYLCKCYGILVFITSGC